MHLALLECEKRENETYLMLILLSQLQDQQVHEERKLDQYSVSMHVCGRVGWRNYLCNQPLVAGQLYMSCDVYIKFTINTNIEIDRTQLLRIYVKSNKTNHSMFLVSNEIKGKQEGEPHKRELTPVHVVLHLPVHQTYHTLFSFSSLSSCYITSHSPIFSKYIHITCLLRKVTHRSISKLAVRNRHTLTLL